MKNELSSVDIRILTMELEEVLVGAKVDKVYEAAPRELVFRLYGKGTVDFVVARNFFCITGYRRKAQREPSPFVMQLRKHLRGKSIAGFGQHGFERIVKLFFEGYVLVFEFFSKGNIILCDESMKIIGLLDWQKWRDRTLGVGRTYEYPPAVYDPSELDEDDFIKVLASSDSSVASTLARKFSLGGDYAELVCESADVNPGSKYDSGFGGRLWKSVEEFVEGIGDCVRGGDYGRYLETFGGETGAVESFNEAVDEHFSRMDIEAVKGEADELVKSKKRKLGNILEKQRKTYVEAVEDSKSEKIKGDLLYQNMAAINGLADEIRRLRKGGLDDEEILEKIGGCGFAKDLKGNKLTLSFD